MISRIVIGFVMIISLGLRSIEDRQPIEYYVGECVPRKFLEIASKDSNYKKTKELYFTIYERNNNYSLLLSRNTSKTDVIGRLVRSSGRFIQLGVDRIPLISDYDLKFGTTEKSDAKEIEQKVTLILQEGYLIEFDKHDYCKIIGVSYSK